MLRAQAIPFAVVFSLAAATLSASGGFLLSDPEPGQDVPSICDGTTFLTPSDGGSLFFLRSWSVSDSDPAENDMLWNVRNGTSIGPGPTSCDWQEDAAGFGNWQCFNSTFTPEPSVGQTLWGVITVYPSGLPDGTHEGWIVLDNSPGADSDATRPMSPQRLRIPVATPGGIDFVSGRIDGVVIEFEYPTEFSDSAEVGTCFLGGNTDQTGFDGRVIGGFNLYRLRRAAIDPADSRPEHYLCGPDLDCAAAADNGWVSYIPLDPRLAGCGIDDAPCQSTFPDLWPYEVVDLPRTPNVDVRFVDRPSGAGAEYAWVVQPVLRVNDIGNLSDWHWMKALDLDGDGMPEFVDPGGHGLGLTANGLAVPAGNGGGATPDLPIILITKEAVGAVGPDPCDPLVFDSDITVSQGSGCSLEVRWDPATGVGPIRYDLYRDASSPVSLDPAHLVATDLTQASHSDGVEGGTDWIYRVVAKDGCMDPGQQTMPNSGGDSAPVRISPIVFDSAIGVADNGWCRLQLNWDPATGGGGRIVYDLYRHTRTPVPLDGAHLVEAGLEGVSYVENLSWGSEYGYRVVARDECRPNPQTRPNAGGDSVPMALTDAAPPRFDGISDVRDTLVPCRVEVLWDVGSASDACSGLSHFVIYRNQPVATALASPYEIPSRGNGNWRYWVRAVDRAGNVDENQVFLDEIENSCPAPADARLSNRRNIERPEGDGSIRINWEASLDHGGPEGVTYAVLRGPLLDLQTAGYTYAMVDPAACDITDTNYLMAGQVDGTAYYYLIATAGVSGTRFGFDWEGVERPGIPLCP